MTAMRTYKHWLPVALWMGFIFTMSTDIGSAAQTSKILQPLILWLKPDASPEQFELVHFLVRKLAHLSEYAVLALLNLRSIRITRFNQTHRWSWSSAGLALLIAAAYAATDEWHQTFVPGRTAAVGDVLIDSSGATFALILAFLWHSLASISLFSSTPLNTSSPAGTQPGGAGTKVARIE